MRQSALILSTALVVVALANSPLLAHCQIPCGIYNDPVRITLMEEHVTTIEKSMTQIRELSQQADANVNQLARWVSNKEAHADELTQIVTFYFMAQRIKPADPADRAAQAKYLKELTTLHAIIVTAMKAKQTTDLENCQKLRALIAKFKASYLGPQARTASKQHTHDHPHPHPHR